jgi:HEAT repeat protein
MGPAGAPAVPALDRALSDPDPRVRSLAAVTLRGMGPSAAKAIPGLVKALDDPSPYVRALDADAVGNLGPSAKPVVDVLGRHLASSNEQVVFVLRSIAAALGNIGPDAASALPALEQALKMVRVTYTAQEAIHKIKGEPVAVWY